MMMMTCLIGDVVVLSFVPLPTAAEAGEVELPAVVLVPAAAEAGEVELPDVALVPPAAKAGEIELPVKAPMATQANNFRRSPAELTVIVFMAHPEVSP